MPCRRVLATTHPELVVIDRRGHIEFRVANHRLAGDGSGRVIRGYSGLTWLDALIVAALAIAWSTKNDNRLLLFAITIASLLYIRFKVTQVLWESVIVLPPHGIQIETHRGLPELPLFISRRFVPKAALHDFIINEGLRGWDIKYYLAAMAKSKQGNVDLVVAYENILPPFPILLEVYNGVQSFIHVKPHR